ncbi:MAG: transglutaminase family protein, partial [Verrucomicrobia bacterium]|nr:transglutaminase family protein [Verrucomicrobiota bacterium]
MDFEITHVTDYTYANAAAEAYLETRLRPPDLPTQTVGRRRLSIDPVVKTSSYRDFFGNHVEFFSLPYRHRSLTITSKVEIRTA